MDDMLIKKIVLAVIEQLNANSRKKTDSIFVLSDNIYLKNTLEANGFNVYMSPNINDININDYKAIIIEELSVDMLTSIANLVYKDKNISSIIEALFLGKVVIALRGGIKYYKYKETSSKELYSKLMDLENIVKSYGLLILDFINIFQYIIKGNGNKNKKIDKSYNTDYFDLTNKKVITEDDIIEVIDNFSGIKVNKGIIITPLVMDYIREYNIEIIYK